MADRENSIGQFDLALQCCFRTKYAGCVGREDAADTMAQHRINAFDLPFPSIPSQLSGSFNQSEDAIHARMAAAKSATVSVHR